ncbi:MAG: NAD+ synthase [Rhodospirillaceae bacterium]|nr:NAD+ synthase [Rhodospirillaceae bacterium]
MTATFTIALAQIDPTVGDIAGNVALIRAARAEAAKAKADLVVFPELSVVGYPPEDLIYRSAFLDAAQKAVNELAKDTADGGPALIVGAPWRGDGKDDGKTFNAALVLDGGAISAIRFKHHLPNYGVFDEKRVFDSGPAPGPVVVRGFRLGLMVCEDMWFEDIAETLVESGAEILIVPNGSPFDVEKPDVRLNHAVARVTETLLPLIYVNQVCGQDDLVFDGASFVLNADRSLAVQMASWTPELAITTWTRAADETLVCTKQNLTPPLSKMESIYQALMLGLGDYVRKNKFPGVVLGLSGGIDSALAAAVAADALGPDKVHCVMMPSPYTSQESLDDAEAVAKYLGVKLDTISIGPAMAAYDTMLKDLFAGTQANITEENLQSRARGMALMALSNKFGKMVLSTGNKSEMSTGYATLYGDMCGGYAVLKDVYKTTVFELCKWRNANKPQGALGPAGKVMPENVITKPPTAELKPNQKDQDTLPPYEVLDAILHGLIEDAAGVDAITARGFEAATVKRVYKMLKTAEYKRRQAPPGVKITHLAFGRDYRYPITNGFQDDGHQDTRLQENGVPR